MLKKVVLPAPFGPMIDTIERGATAIETSLTATSPPNALLTRAVASIAPSLDGSTGSARVSARHAHARASNTDSSTRVLGELDLAPSFGQDPLGSEHHHEHEHEAEDAE